MLKLLLKAAISNVCRMFFCALHLPICRIRHPQSDRVSSGIHYCIQYTIHCSIHLILIVVAVISISTSTHGSSTVYVTSQIIWCGRQTRNSSYHPRSLYFVKKFNPIVEHWREVWSHTVIEGSGVVDSTFRGSWVSDRPPFVCEYKDLVDSRWDRAERFAGSVAFFLETRFSVACVIWGWPVSNPSEDTWRGFRCNLHFFSGGICIMWETSVWPVLLSVANQNDSYKVLCNVRSHSWFWLQQFSCSVIHYRL